jgi:hypothetical protein
MAGDVMVHREISNLRTWRWRLARDLVVLGAFAVVFSVAFVIGDLIAYGRVNW